MLARERIERIIDPERRSRTSPLLHTICTMAVLHSQSIVTGIGCVTAERVLFVANDATVKGGPIIQ